MSKHTVINKILKIPLKKYTSKIHQVNQKRWSMSWQNWEISEKGKGKHDLQNMSALEGAQRRIEFAQSLIRPWKTDKNLREKWTEGFKSLLMADIKQRKGKMTSHTNTVKGNFRA